MVCAHGRRACVRRNAPRGAAGPRHPRNTRGDAPRPQRASGRGRRACVQRVCGRGRRACEHGHRKVCARGRRACDHGHRKVCARDRRACGRRSVPRGAAGLRRLGSTRGDAPQPQRVRGRRKASGRGRRACVQRVCGRGLRKASGRRHRRACVQRVYGRGIRRSPLRACGIRGRGWRRRVCVPGRRASFPSANRAWDRRRQPVQGGGTSQRPSAVPPRKACAKSRRPACRPSPRHRWRCGAGESPGAPHPCKGGAPRACGPRRG